MAITLNPQQQQPQQQGAGLFGAPPMMNGYQAKYPITPRPFNDQAFQDLQRQTEQEGRRVSLDEYSGLGGDANEYHKLYGGIDNTAFTNLQKETETAGRRISSEEWAKIGGNPMEYYKLYNDAPPSQTPFGLADSLGKQQQNVNLANVGVDMNLNRLGEENPYGSSEYVRNPDGTYTRKSSLSGNQQSILGSEEQQEMQRNAIGQYLLNQTGQNFQQPFTYDQFQKLPGVDDFFGKMGQARTDYSADRTKAEEAVFGRLSKDLDDRFGREQQQLDTYLANRGIPRDSEQYRTSMQDFEQRKQDAYTDARQRALESSREEFTTMAEQDRAGRTQALNEFAGQFGFSRDARNQQSGEAKDERSNPLSEMSALYGLNKGVRNPAFSPTYNVNVPQVDVTGSAQGFANLGLQGQQLDQNLQTTLLNDQLQRDLQNQQIASNEKIASSRGGGGGGGGGGGAAGPSYEERKKIDFEFNLANYLIESAIKNRSQGNSGGGLDSLWGYLGANLGNAAGSGFFY